MKRVGGRPVVDYCLAYARDKREQREEPAPDALAALENRIDKNIPADSTRIFDIAKDDATPDAVRDRGVRAPRRAPEGA